MSASEKTASGEPDTVLVVEDQVAIRLAVSDFLRNCGYRVLEAANADEALIILRNPNYQIDVLLSDLEMPGATNGFGLARAARELRPGLEIIFAGTAARAADAAADLCNENSVLQKPYDPKMVLDRIKRLLAARQRADRQ